MTEAEPRTGIVKGISSSLILIDDSKFFLGEYKTSGSVEIGDTVEFGSDAHDWLTSLSVIKKANGSTPAASPQKGGPASNAADPAPKCVLGECPDKGSHFSFHKQRNRWECNLMGIDNPNITHCPLVPKKPNGSKTDLKKKVAANGFGEPTEGKPVPAPDPAPVQQKPRAQNTAPKADPPAGQQVQQPPAAPAAAKPPQQQPPAAKPAVNNPGAPPKFRKAARKSAKLRIGLCGTAGSGKTWDALQIAFGIGGSIAVIDTENSSAELYAHLGEYDVCILSAPFTAQKYTDAIHEAERAGYNVIVIDSLTHAWAGEGGLLDLKDNIVKNSRSGNSWAAWKDVTPLHRNLVDAMLQSPSHIIATMRSKTEYVIDTDDRGKSFPRKIGMAPVQREGMDYEFTLVFDIDANHIASASKDRTSLFTGKSFMPSIETGRQLKEWLETESSGGA